MTPNKINLNNVKRQSNMIMNFEFDNNNNNSIKLALPKLADDS